jgi:hypothetical protein
MTEQPTHTIAIKSIKVTIPVPLADFPVHLIPAPGTPGGKNMGQTLGLKTAEGVSVIVPMNGAKLMKLGAAIRAAGEGADGFFVFTGRLGAGGELIDGGAIFQPAKPKTEQSSDQKAA